MNQYQELKDKLNEISVLTRLIVKGWLAQVFSHLDKPPLFKKILTLIRSTQGKFIAGLLVFVIFTIGVTRTPLQGFAPIFWSGWNRANAPENTAGTFIFSDFENESDLKNWSLQSATAKISSNHASHGSGALKTLLLGGESVSGILMNHYFEKRGSKTDWSAYQNLEFYIFNPRNNSERLILQIKDKRGNRFKQDLNVPANAGEIFRIPIQRVSAKVNIRTIDQFNIFRWEPKGDREFYFDHFRLVSDAAEERQTTPEPRVRESEKSRPVKMMDYGFAARKAAWMTPGPEGPAVRIPFVVKNETSALCRRCPVEGGMPFPMGEVQDLKDLQLFDGRMNPLAFQPRILGRWPDGSIRWAGVHFVTDLASNEGAGYFLQYGQHIAPKSDLPLDSENPSLILQETPDSIRITNGSVEGIWSKKSFYLFESLALDENADKKFDPETETLIQKAPLVLSFRGKEFTTDQDKQTYKIKIEENGPFHIVLRAQGWFQSEDGQRYCQVIVRYYLYANTNRIQVNHTLIYTGYPENIFYDAYKGLKLPENETIESFGLTIPYKFEKSPVLRFRSGTANGRSEEFSVQQDFKLSQLDWDRTLWNQDGAFISSSNIPSGWIDISSGRRGIGVMLRDFKENFPKAYRLDATNSKIFVDLWPKEAGEMDLSTTSNAEGPESKARGSAFGLAKTHEIFFYPFDPSKEDFMVPATFMSVQKPLVMRINPYWTDATGVFGRLYPVVHRFATEEKMLDGLFEWAARQPKDFHWYGMLHYGDTLSWHRHEDDSGEYGSADWHPIGRWGWYNCEGVGTHTGSLLQFVRTGQWKYFEFARNNARHLMDIDTIHYNTIAEDPRLKNLISDEMSRVGAMHRHNGDHWGDRSEESSHTSVVGILYYYYLTGDERAFEVAKEIGEFFLLEPFTYSGHPDVAPHRGMANALWGDVLLYEATGDERYKKAADRIIEIYLKGQQSDGSYLENYNPLEQSWNGRKHKLYMEGYLLGALIAYYDLTQDAEVKEMFLRLVRFLGNGPDALHGNAYAYFLTGEAQFIQNLNEGMNELLRNRQVSSDSMINGLIYKKQIYHRPMTYLYDVPYAFEALDAVEAGRR